jgi:hypothetical protein
MRRGVVAALAAGIGMAVSFNGASAHGGYSEYRRDAWYAAYDRIQAARERRRAEAEARAEKRALAFQDRLARLRERGLRGDYDRRWVREGHRAYRDYERYCDCAPYRDYAERPRIYGYRYGYYGYGHAYPAAYGYGYAYPYPDLDTDNRQIKDRDWRPDSYPTGWASWWVRMDRDRRGN